MEIVRASMIVTCLSMGSILLEDVVTTNHRDQRTTGHRYQKAEWDLR